MVYALATHHRLVDTATGGTTHTAPPSRGGRHISTNRGRKEKREGISGGGSRRRRRR